MIGWLFILELTSQHISKSECNSIQTTLCLLCSCLPSECYVLHTNELGWLYFSSPSYTTLLRCRVFVNPLLWGSDDLSNEYLPVLAWTDFFLLCSFDFWRGMLMRGFYSFIAQSFRWLLSDKGERRHFFRKAGDGLAQAWWKVCLCIRSFHSSIQNIRLPQCRTLYIPPWSLLNPKSK